MRSIGRSKWIAGLASGLLILGFTVAKAEYLKTQKMPRCPVSIMASKTGMKSLKVQKNVKSPSCSTSTPAKMLTSGSSTNMDMDGMTGSDMSTSATGSEAGKKAPEPMYQIEKVNGNIAVEIPAMEFTQLTQNYKVTSFILNFSNNGQTTSVAEDPSTYQMDPYGNLEVTGPTAAPGKWTVEVAGKNSVGQGPWCTQSVVIPQTLQEVVAPVFKISYENGNLTATVADADVKTSMTIYETKSFKAQFISPDGSIESAQSQALDAPGDTQISVANPETGTWTVEIAGTNSLGQGPWSAPQTFVVPMPSLSSIPTPTLNCGPSVQGTSQVPVWTTKSGPQLTLTSVTTGVTEATWCPASVVSTNANYGPIIYTVTLSPGGETCTTWTSDACLISNAPSNPTAAYILSSNKIGVAPTNQPTVANSGNIQNCNPPGSGCDVGPLNQSFPAYGNTSSGIDDCTFAAAAYWELLADGTSPDPTELGMEFVNAGGSMTSGLTATQLFNYWQTQGIGGIKIRSEQSIPVNEIDLENAISGHGQLIAAVSLTPAQNIAGIQAPMQGYHMLVIDGYTPTGPLIVTWGQTLQMTWQQWDLEAENAWAINQ